MMRLATLADIDALVELAAAIEPGRVDREAFGRYLAAMIRGGQGELEPFVLVAEASGAIVSAIICALYRAPLTGQLVCDKLHWGSSPERPGYGVRLLQAAERWAIAGGAQKMTVSIVGQRQAKALCRLGYAPAGEIYEKGLANGD